MKKITLLFLQLFLSFIMFSQKITSVSPNTAAAGDSLTILIKTSGTHFTQSSNFFMEIYCNQTNERILVKSKTINNDSSLSVNITVPVNAITGDYYISFFGTFDGDIGLDSCFHVKGFAPPLPPELVKVSPATATYGQTLDVTITGASTHFNKGSNMAVYFAFKQGSGTTSTNPNSITIINDTVVKANVTVPAYTLTGDYSITTYDSIDGYLILRNAFHINGIIPASFVSISPATATNGQTLDVTITGAKSHFNQGSPTSISFQFKQASGTTLVVPNSITVINDLTIKANITVPANTFTGNYYVSFNNAIDGLQYLINGFHVNGIAPPSLVSINPASANMGQTLDVTITGANTHFTQGSGTAIRFNFNQASGTTAVNSFTVINDVTIKANLTVPPKVFTGDYSFYVNNSIDGYNELNNSFHVNGVVPPSIVSASPAGAMPGDKLDVTITGSNTHFTKVSGTSSVYFSFYQASGTINVNSINVINDSSMSINITVPPNADIQVPKFYIYNSIDGQLIYDFLIYDNCLPYFTTNYDNVKNEFSLVLDARTTDSTTNYYWDFGDGSTSASETPDHTFAKDSTYNVCLKTIKISGDSCSYCHVIGKNAAGHIYRGAGFSLQAYKYDLTIGIPEITKGSSLISVSPNPTSGSLTITTQSLEVLHNPIVYLYSLDGTLLLQQGLKDAKTTLDLSSFANGFYILKILSNETIEVVKIIKE